MSGSLGSLPRQQLAHRTQMLQRLFEFEIINGMAQCTHFVLRLRQALLQQPQRGLVEATALQFGAEALQRQ